MAKKDAVSKRLAEEIAFAKLVKKELPALLQLGVPGLGSYARDIAQKPILDAFKEFGLDHRNLSDWRALVFHLARVLFPTPRPPGAPRKWPGERLCQLLADVAAAKRKRPNASDTVICKRLEKRYRPLSAARLRRILQDARNPARNHLLATALVLVGPQILEEERAMHETWTEADEKKLRSTVISWAIQNADKLWGQ